MKSLTLKTVISICSYEELTEEDRQLVDAAKEATNRSYVPYSHFRVGAAARLVDGSVITGNNQENAAYPSGLCAERTTLFYAGAQYPELAVDALAIAARTEDEFLKAPIPPCGGCRQVMLETEKRSNHPLRVILYGTKEIYVLRGVDTLLPLSFGADMMEF